MTETATAMTDEDDYLFSSLELELRIEPRVQERLAAAGVPPAEAERVLAEALEYVRLRRPPPRELERRFLFAVGRACRRYEAERRARIAAALDALRDEIGDGPGAPEARGEEP